MGKFECKLLISKQNGSIVFKTCQWGFLFLLNLC